MLSNCVQSEFVLTSARLAFPLILRVLASATVSHWRLETVSGPPQASGIVIKRVYLSGNLCELCRVGFVEGWRMTRYGLRDDQWERINDLLPGKLGVGATARDNRRFVEAAL